MFTCSWPLVLKYSNSHLLSLKFHCAIFFSKHRLAPQETAQRRHLRLYCSETFKEPQNDSRRVLVFNAHPLGSHTEAWGVVFCTELQLRIRQTTNEPHKHPTMPFTTHLCCLSIGSVVIQANTVRIYILFNFMLGDENGYFSESMIKILPSFWAGHPF